MTDVMHGNASGGEFRRVALDVQADSFPALMDALSAFAVAHNITIDVTRAPLDTTEPSITAAPGSIESPRYNPELVGWLTDPETEKDVPIVTELAVKEFGKAHGYAHGVMAYRALVRSVDGRYAGFDSTADYLLGVPEFDWTAYYLRADKLSELVARLSRGTLSVYAFGENHTAMLKTLSAAVLDTTQE